MSKTRATVPVATVVLGLALIAVTGAAVAQTAHILVPADKVQWGPAPPVLPAGAQLAVLEGNPAEKGPIVMRLKLPANYALPPHWHTNTERLTVLSGSFHAGMGDKLDRMMTQTLEPGGYVMLPGNMHHFAWTSAPTVVQLNFEGPFDMFYVNPSEDPQQKKTTR
jgi:anti-sigma factor ChrR (cupin superfamily)